jgi:hypothetical protein
MLLTKQWMKVWPLTPLTCKASMRNKQLRLAIIRLRNQNPKNLSQLKLESNPVMTKTNKSNSKFTKMRLLRLQAPNSNPRSSLKMKRRETLSNINLDSQKSTWKSTALKLSRKSKEWALKMSLSLLMSSPMSPTCSPSQCSLWICSASL